MISKFYEDECKVHFRVTRIYVFVCACMCMYVDARASYVIRAYNVRSCMHACMYQINLFSQYYFITHS